MIEISSFHKYSKSRVRFAILLFFLAIVLLACGKDRSEISNVPAITIPSTNFLFQPIDSYQVAESDGMIRMYKPVDRKSPSFLIWGRSFSGYVSQDSWLEDRFDELNFKDPEAIEINGISGYVVKHEDQGVVSWMAILATEREGMVLLAHSEPTEQDSAETLFRTVLESVLIQESDN